MEAINELFKLDVTPIILGIFIIMAACIAICDIVGKFSVLIKRPLGKYKQREEDHKLVVENAKAIKELAERHEKDKEQSIVHDKRIDDKLENLTQMFINKEINDMRWSILDFTSALSSGRKYNKESFDQIFRTYDNYEELLDNHNMKNGLVKESMEYVNEVYHEKLKNGF